MLYLHAFKETDDFKDLYWLFHNEGQIMIKLLNLDLLCDEEALDKSNV